jgi:hypothetical protein
MSDQLVALAEPVRLALLALVPLFALVALLRGRGRRAGAGVAGLLAVLAFAVLTVGFAGPTLTQRQTRERGTVILAIDVSTSMEADDVAPRRFDAAKSAADSFIDLLPPTINVGLVSFNATAKTAVPPTADHASVRKGIDGLALGSGTASLLRRRPAPAVPPASFVAPAPAVHGYTPGPPPPPMGAYVRR